MRAFLGGTGLVLGLVLGLATTAPAADMRMPVKAPVVAPPPLYSWTGLYIGGHVGYGWADNNWGDPTGAFGLTTDIDGDGFLGGGQVGFNWQWNNIVLGLEAQFSAADIDGSETFTVVPGIATLALSNNIDWITSVTGRLGFAANNWLFYGKGGWAWADYSAAATATILGVSATATADDTRDGWTAGAGVEWGFAPGWSAFAEYQYYDFGDDTFTFVGTPVTIDTDIHTVKVGLNWRLGGLFR